MARVNPSVVSVLSHFRKADTGLCRFECLENFAMPLASANSFLCLLLCIRHELCAENSEANSVLAATHSLTLPTLVLLFSPTSLSILFTTYDAVSQMCSSVHPYFVSSLPADLFFYFLFFLCKETFGLEWRVFTPEADNPRYCPAAGRGGAQSSLYHVQLKLISLSCPFTLAIACN